MALEELGSGHAAVSSRACFWTDIDRDWRTPGLGSGCCQAALGSCSCHGRDVEWDWRALELGHAAEWLRCWLGALRWEPLSLSGYTLGGPCHPCNLRAHPHLDGSRKLTQI